MQLETLVIGLGICQILIGVGTLIVFRGVMQDIDDLWKSQRRVRDDILTIVKQIHSIRVREV